MKKNKLTIYAFEKYSLTNANKINVKGGLPEGWNETNDPNDDIILTEEDPEPNNGTGGPSSSPLSTGVIKLVVEIIKPIVIKP